MVDYLLCICYLCIYNLSLHAHCPLLQTSPNLYLGTSEPLSRECTTLEGILHCIISADSNSKFKARAYFCTILVRSFSLFRGQKAKMLDSSAYDLKSGNPFSDRPPTSRRNEEAQRAMDAAVAELDSNAPDNFDSSIWERLCRYRRAKIEFEVNVSALSI